MTLNSIKKKPEDLFRWTRFDLPFKSLYADAYVRGLQTDFFEEMYCHHLKVWNNFEEHKNPDKTGYSAFKKSYHELIADIGDNGFDELKSLVPIVGDNHILNGAHRVAACFVHNTSVYCTNGTDRVDGQFDCSWGFFKQHLRFGKLSREFADRAAMEIARHRPEARLITVFPSAVSLGKLTDVERLINEYTKPIYERAIPISKEGAVNFMRELYYKEAWAVKNNGTGYRAKASFCYPSRWLRKMSPTQVYLVELEDLEVAAKLKEEIRRIYQLEKHSVHINDTHAETIRIASCIFNSNSVNFLNKFNGQFYPQFEELLAEYQSWIHQKNLGPEDYCISAGSVLTAFGLKECKDIDYLHCGPAKYTGNPLIQSHNVYGEGRYHLHRDDIVHNPRNHFYRYGVKYSSVEVVKRLKEKRGEAKDFKDIKLLKALKL